MRKDHIQRRRIPGPLKRDTPLKKFTMYGSSGATLVRFDADNRETVTLLCDPMEEFPTIRFRPWFLGSFPADPIPVEQIIKAIQDREGLVAPLPYVEWRDEVHLSIAPLPRKEFLQPAATPSLQMQGEAGGRRALETSG